MHASNSLSIPVVVRYINLQIQSSKFSTVEPAEGDDGDSSTHETDDEPHCGPQSHARTDECNEKDEHIQL